MRGFDPDQPYNALPLLPPKAHLETPEVLKAVVAASRDLFGLPNTTCTVKHREAIADAAAAAVCGIVGDVA